MNRRYQQFADTNLSVTAISGSEAMCRCIVHDDSKASMQFNLDTGLWVCFACGEGGSIKRLLRELGIDRFMEAEPDILDIQRKVRLLSKPKQAAPDPVPESYLTRFKFPTRYWTGRGFTQDTIDAFDLGYDPLENAATIPMRDFNGVLLGVTKRFLDEDVELRYQYPWKFKRSSNLFGSWLAEHHDSATAVLVEGAVDAMKVWQAGYIGLAVYGSSISVAQVRLLRRMGFTTVVDFFDNDKAGQKAGLSLKGVKVHRRKGQDVREYAPDLDLRRDFIVKRVSYRHGDHSDPGAMNTRQIKFLVDHAESIM